MAATDTLKARRESILALEERLVTPDEVAAYLGMSRAKIYQMMASGELPCIKVGGNRRVRFAALNAYIDRLERESAVPVAVLA